MKTKYHIPFGGRVALSGSERHIETTSFHGTKNILKRVGLDTPLKKHSGLLDQRGTL